MTNPTPLELIVRFLELGESLADAWHRTIDAVEDLNGLERSEDGSTSE